MAVFVYSTGSINGTVAAGNTVTITIDNRTTATQPFRATLWDTSNGLSPKVQLATLVATIGANGGVSFTLTAAAAATAFEIEVRLPNEHMTTDIASATGGIATALANKLPILPGEFFRDSDPAGSV